MIKQVAPFIDASNLRQLNPMGWTGGFYFVFFLFTLVESSSRSGMLVLNLGTESTYVINWPIFSASIFVLVALVLSMYLIFEHLAAYNQPEVCSLIALLVWRKIYLIIFFICDSKIYLMAFHIACFISFGMVF